MRAPAAFFFASLAATTQSVAGPLSEQNSNQDELAYGIVEYRIDSPNSVIYMTRRRRLFGDRYIILRTTCLGDFPTLFLGSGETAEEATSDSMIIGNGGLLIFGTGDDAPRIACGLVGLGNDLEAPAQSGGAVKPKRAPGADREESGGRGRKE